VFRAAAVVLPLAFLASACTTKQASPPTAPLDAVDESAIRNGAWVTDRDALRLAAASAVRHPLVAATLAAVGSDRLDAMPQSTIRAVGSTVGGLPVEFTMLPYVRRGDPSHGVFVTLGRIGDEERVEEAEMIVGREPRADEPGFVPVSIPGGVVWIAEGDAAARPSAGVAARSPARLNKLAFLTCLVSTAPGACDAGAAIASQIAPNVPVARAVGCAVGVAGAALACLSSAHSAPKPR
jgi:hypothetical protein